MSVYEELSQAEQEAMAEEHENWLIQRIENIKDIESEAGQKEVASVIADL